LLYSGDKLYAAMAFQSEFTYMDVYTTTNEIEWTCNYTSLVLPGSDRGVHRMEFYRYTQYTPYGMHKFSYKVEISLSGAEITEDWRKLP